MDTHSYLERPVWGFLYAFTLPLTFACQQSDAGNHEGQMVDEAVETSDTSMTSMVSGLAPQMAALDTTATAIWVHLVTADYRSTWERWPGRPLLYEGGEPHGMLLNTYLNDVAASALMEGSASMPMGAVIVKDNYTPDSTLAAVTVMYKHSGYNTEHNDWYFLKRLADGTIEASGRVATCQNCHATQAANDYIMTETLSGTS